MSDCPLCGKKTLLFVRVHPDCQKKHDIGVSLVRKFVYDAIVQQTDLEKARRDAEDTALKNLLRRAEIASLTADAWTLALDYYARDSVLSEDELQRLHEAARILHINPDLLKLREVPQKIEAVKQKMATAEKTRAFAMAKQQVVARLRAGEFPKYPYAVPPLPFLIDNNWLLWLFQNVTYMEEKTRRKTIRHSVGRSYHGFYAGQSQSESIESTGIESIDVGMVVLTSKQIYFTGAKKSFRIPYAKLVIVKPYNDAVEFVKDGVTAKRQFFKDLDGVFAHGLIRAIADQHR